MKKAVIITLSIIISIVLLCFVAWRVFVNIAGGFVINKLVESVDEDTFAQLEQSLEQVENLDALLGQVENPVIEQPIDEQPIIEEKIEQNVEVVESAASSAEVVKDVPQQSETKPTQTSQSGPSNTVEKVDETKKEDESVGSKLSKVSYEDKSAAIKMLKNKFTISEIMYYQDKVFNGGLNAELIKEVKTILKQRCTKEEIAQLKEWYNKYK